MRSRKTIIIVIVLLISVLSLNKHPSFAKDNSGELLQETNYVEHEPIIILSDDNFTDYGFQGDGTLVNPFRIQDLNITTTEDKGIYICNTTKHFIIQNCFVDAYRGGIVIDSVRKETTRIEDNICVGNSATGIRILHSPGTKIINNTCNFNSFAGIHVRNSYESQIEKLA